MRTAARFLYIIIFCLPAVVMLFLMMIGDAAEKIAEVIVENQP